MNEILSKTEYLLQILFYIIQGFFHKLGSESFLLIFGKHVSQKLEMGNHKLHVNCHTREKRLCFLTNLCKEKPYVKGLQLWTKTPLRSDMF